MAGRKPGPPAVNIQQGWANGLRDRHRSAFLHLLENLAYVDDAEAKGEAEPSIAAIYRLQLLFNRMQKDTFDWDGWTRFTASDPSGSVRVPKSWIAPILDAFENYRFGDDNPAFEKAFGASRTKQHDTARKEIETLEHYARLATMIQEERITAVALGEVISLEEAKARVIDRMEGEDAGVSEKTLERAWLRWGDLIDKLTTIRSAKPR